MNLSWKFVQKYDFLIVFFFVTVCMFLEKMGFWMNYGIPHQFSPNARYGALLISNSWSQKLWIQDPADHKNGILFNWQIWFLFKSLCKRWKKIQICILLQAIGENIVLCYLLFYKIWQPCFLISESLIFWFFKTFFLLNDTEFRHATSHQKSSKYDSLSSSKFSMYLKKQNKNKTKQFRGKAEDRNKHL